MRRNRISRRDNRPAPTTYEEAFRMKGTYAVKQMRERRKKKFENKLAKLRQELEETIASKKTDLQEFQNVQHTI